MDKKIIVTLDGPAGVGKSTIAKRLAQALEIPYLDTGAMFRGVAWSLGDGAWDWSEQDIMDRLNSLNFSLGGSGESSIISLNGKALGSEIRTEEVGMWGSNVARLPVVRDYLKKTQQDLGRGGSLVAEGRDMGTVVFPDARCKFFLDASLDVRTMRRLKQLKNMGREVDPVELRESIRMRDEQDRNRKTAPLKPAEDAALVDSSDMDKDQVFETIMSVVRSGCSN